MTPKHAADLELAQRIVVGDEAAATEVFRRLSSEMYGFARKMLDDAGQAEDALQETMLAVLRNAATYDGRVALLGISYSAKQGLRYLPPTKPRYSRFHGRSRSRKF
jgi:hypothetical protein